MPFAEGAFDLVWAIESVCHAESKQDFLKEAYRLLRKGGRLIIADGFQSKCPLTESEAALLKKSFNGWWVSSLEPGKVFHGHLKKLNLGISRNRMSHGSIHNFWKKITDPDEAEQGQKECEKFFFALPRAERAVTGGEKRGGFS